MMQLGIRNEELGMVEGAHKIWKRPNTPLLLFQQKQLESGFHEYDSSCFYFGELYRKGILLMKPWV